MVNDECDGLCDYLSWEADLDDFVDNLDLAVLCDAVSLQEMPERPVLYSFYFNPDDVQAWLEKEGKMYDQIDKMYARQWENMGEELKPIWDDFSSVMEKYDRKFQNINDKHMEQWDDTMNDVGKWLEENFHAEEMTYVSLSAKVKSNRSTVDTKMFAAAGIAGLAVLAALVYQKSKKEEEKAPRKEQVFESLVERVA